MQFTSQYHCTKAEKLEPSSPFNCEKNACRFPEVIASFSEIPEDA
jgi:hypothetical protein